MAEPNWVQTASNSLDESWRLDWVTECPKLPTISGAGSPMRSLRHSAAFELDPRETILPIYCMHNYTGSLVPSNRTFSSVLTGFPLWDFGNEKLISAFVDLEHSFAYAASGRGDTTTTLRPNWSSVVGCIGYLDDLPMSDAADYALVFVTYDPTQDSGDPGLLERSYVTITPKSVPSYGQLIGDAMRDGGGFLADREGSVWIPPAASDGEDADWPLMVWGGGRVVARTFSDIGTMEFDFGNGNIVSDASAQQLANGYWIWTAQPPGMSEGEAFDDYGMWSDPVVSPANGGNISIDVAYEINYRHIQLAQHTPTLWGDGEVIPAWRKAPP